MEDCTVTTQFIDGFHHTYYSRDGVIVAHSSRGIDDMCDVEVWESNNKIHRECGPAMIFYENDQVHTAYWYRNGKLCPISVLASVVVYQNFDQEHDYWIGDRITKNINKYRNIVKGDAIRDVLRPLPIPIRDAIIPHYCYQ